MAVTTAWREQMRKRLKAASGKDVKRKSILTVDRATGKATVQRFDRIGAKFIRIGQQQFTTLKDARAYALNCIKK
jgi:hypothetical protein